MTFKHITLIITYMYHYFITHFIFFMTIKYEIINAILFN